jgi:serine protease Do
MTAEMKRLTHYLLAFVFVTDLLSGTGSSARADEANPKSPNLRETPIVKAVRKAKPSVVTLKVQRSSAYSTREVVGSAVVVDERGYAVTNRHVISGSGGVKAVLADGTECTAQVFIEDARHDLAILKLPVGKKQLPAITFAPASNLMEGETVIAIGHPYGYVNTVSTGIISGLGREITMPTGEKLTGLIQVTASINPGNSGGPLLNIYGDLIGINVAMRDGAQGIAFALNADLVKDVLAKHLSAANVSRVEHGLACRDAVVESDEPRQQVVVESGTQELLKRGDVIVAIGERAVTNRFDLERSLWDHKAGDVVSARVVRHGKVTQVALTLLEGKVASADTRPQTGSAQAARPVGQR